MSLLDRLRAVADEVFAGSPVLFAELYGSQATGRANTRSDVDVAVFVDSSTPADERLDLSLRLAGRLEQALGVGPVEALLVLNEAPLALAGRVLRDRQVFYSRDEPARVAYESRIFRQFIDFERHAEPLRQAHLRMLAGRRV